MTDKSPHHFVPAASGYVHLRYYVEWGEDGGAGVERRPVASRRIDGNTAVPITPDNDDGSSSNLIGSGVLLADGQVVQPYVQTFPDEEAWRAAMAEQAESQLQASR